MPNDKQNAKRSFTGSNTHVLALVSAWDILLNAVMNFRRNGDVNLAAAIAFYAILSSLPLLILTLLAASLVFGANPEIPQKVISMVQDYNPYFSGEFLNQLVGFQSKGKLLGWVGIVMLVWTASLIFNSLQTALSTVFRSRESFTYLTAKLVAIAMIPLGWIVGVVNFGITYAGTLIERNPLAAEAGPFTHVLLNSFLFRYLLPYLLIVAFFTLVYRIMSSGKVSFINALVGSALFSGLMEVTKHGFAWYMAENNRYNIIYGSLETVVLLVVWFYYISLILLFCGELIASYQKRDLVLLEKALIKSGTKS